MVLVLFTHTRQVLDNVHTNILQNFSITNSGTFKNSRGSICSCRNDDHLLRLDGAWRCISNMQELWIGHILWVGLILHSDGLLALEDHPQDLLLGQDMQVGVLVGVLEFGVQVSMSCVLTSSVWTDVLVVTLDRIVVVQVLQVSDFWIA